MFLSGGKNTLDFGWGSGFITVPSCVVVLRKTEDQSEPQSLHSQNMTMLRIKWAFWYLGGSVQ